MLVAPATVAMRVWEPLQPSRDGSFVSSLTRAMQVWEELQQNRDISLIESFDEESVVMVETALRVGAFLEQAADGEQDTSPPKRQNTSPVFQRPTKPSKTPLAGRWSGSIDFTPGAQGAWKAFEREINLSVIQAARASRQVKMPNLFALYDPNLSESLGQVCTGYRNRRPIIKDINQRDWERLGTKQHRFLSLGDAFYVVTRGMMGRSTERFDEVIESCLHQPLPSKLIDAWKRIYHIRNDSSHTEPLTKSDYEQVLNDALSPNVLLPLMKIKKALSQ